MGLVVAAVEVGIPERRALSTALAPASSPQSWHRAVKSSATAVITNTLSKEREEARNPRPHHAV